MREHDTFSQQIKTTVSLRQEPQSPCIFRLRLQFRNRLLLLGDFLDLHSSFLARRVAHAAEVFDGLKLHHAVTAGRRPFASGRGRIRRRPFRALPSPGRTDRTQCTSRASPAIRRRLFATSSRRLRSRTRRSRRPCRDRARRRCRGGFCRSRTKACRKGEALKFVRYSPKRSSRLTSDCTMPEYLLCRSPAADTIVRWMAERVPVTCSKTPSLTFSLS